MTAKADAPRLPANLFFGSPSLRISPMKLFLDNPTRVGCNCINLSSDFNNVKFCFRFLPNPIPETISNDNLSIQYYKNNENFLSKNYCFTKK